MRKRPTTFLIALLAVCLFLAPPAQAVKLHEKLPDIHGFAEGDFGLRYKEDTTAHDRYNLAEQRIQLKTTYYPEEIPLLSDWNTEINFKGDLLVDEYFGRVSYDVRELNALFSPISFADVKAGRQILTWGTGDYIFINDVFPKDWVSFFIGRDDEYLKKPSDALKISLNHKIASLDTVWIPFFSPDTMTIGDRVSFYDTTLGYIAGEESDLFKRWPGVQFENSEVALRLHGLLGSYEWAAYWFRGFYQTAVGQTPYVTRNLFYPDLMVYGGSFRGPMPRLGGIWNVEVGFYDSRQDKHGDNPLIKNSDIRYLFGYTRDFENDVKIGFQYYVEQMLDYHAYEDNLIPGSPKHDHFKQLLTLRLSKLFLMQTVEAGVFVFFSPTDEDTYIRPTLSWDVTDKWKVTVGGNLFWGKKDYTMFGQYEKNTNTYIRVRYSF